MKSVREVMDEAGCLMEQSVYEDTSVLDYRMPIDHGFGLKKVNLEHGSWNKVRKYQAEVLGGKQSKEYQEVTKSLKTLPAEDRDKKAVLRKQKRQMQQEILKNAFLSAFPDAESSDSIYAVSYKSGVYALNLREMAARRDLAVPAGMERFFTRDGNPFIESPEDIPWFLSDIEWFAETVDHLADEAAERNARASGDHSADSVRTDGKNSGRAIGMEGGYCILGTDEMLFHIILENGEEHIFDFNTMQELTGKGEALITSETDTALWEFMQRWSGEIQSVSIECDKDRITIDELAQLCYLFIMADYFQAKLVVTIPDMSYDKTFLQTFGGIRPEIFEPLHAEFLAHLDRISDICIDWIEECRRVFPDLTVDILHRRNEEFLRIFYEERVKYLDAYAKKHLTTIRDGRRDALMDYVCMPAAPFYRWNTKDVIEVNRLEEYPSIEKCRRIHKGNMHLHSMLFPQAPCGNGVTSCFYARRKYKDYVDLP